MQYHPKCKKVSLTPLCFAHDLMIFSEGGVDDIFQINTIFHQFYSLNDLKFNPSKSELFCASISEEQHVVFHDRTGFPIGKLSVRYLGVPLIPGKLFSND